MYIKQISVYLENVKGSLHELMETLGKSDINLLALSIADTTGFGIVRFITKSADTDRAVSVLKENGYIAKASDIICIQVPHKPLGFASVLSVLEKNDISVEYSYSFCRSTINDAVVLIRPSDNDKSVEILKAENVKIITQNQVDEF